MKRANTHSLGIVAPGGIGRPFPLYSPPGYSRNFPGCWAARFVRLPTLDGSSKGAVAHTALKSARQGIANRRPRNFIIEVAGVRIARWRSAAAASAFRQIGNRPADLSSMLLKSTA